MNIFNIEYFKELFSSVYSKEKNNIEEAIQVLRKEGASQGKSVFVVKQILGITLTEADSIILYSKTWEDCRENTEKLRQAMCEAWEEAIGDEIIEV